jgi:PAT family beta-lactamase induction signal transducer AmpG
LLRMTQKRFSATQYALFSSLFALPRILAGPVTGVLVDAIGWRNFFLCTIAAGLPGMILLQRFSPFGARDPEFAVETVRVARPLRRGVLIVRSAIGGAIGSLVGALAVVLLGAMKQFHKAPEQGFDVMASLSAFLSPQTLAGWLQLAGVLLFGAVMALATAATFFARSGGVATLKENTR